MTLDTCWTAVLTLGTLLLNLPFRARCWWSGHDDAVERDASTPYLRCTRCWRRTPGFH